MKKAAVLVVLSLFCLVMVGGCAGKIAESGALSGQREGDSISKAVYNEADQSSGENSESAGAEEDKKDNGVVAAKGDEHSAVSATGEEKIRDAGKGAAAKGDVRSVPSKSAGEEGLIAREKALAIALKHAGLPGSAISRLEVELDYEDGRRVYEIEFYAGNAEYDYEIDARTGEIRSFDHDFKKGKAEKSGAAIGDDKAVSIALKDAGLSGSAVSRLKVELDRDDGREIYEVEFYSGNKEYEYEIDAYSGVVLSHGVEND